MINIDNLIKSNINILLLVTVLSIFIIDNFKIYLVIGVFIAYFIYINTLNEEKDKDINEIKIKTLLQKLRKYKKYNKVEYNNGKNILKNIFKIINNKDIYEHRNYQTDKLKILINQCIDHFKSILLSIPLNKYEDFINYKNMQTKYSDYSKLCELLSNYLYNELYLFNLDYKVTSHNSNPIANYNNNVVPQNSV